MTPLACVFWLGVACVLYTYVVYPLLVNLLARRRPVAGAKGPGGHGPSVSVILAARNEEARIGRRIREIGLMLAARPAGGELIVVSDGSTDRTEERARAAADGIAAEAGRGVQIRVLSLPGQRGKAVALNEGCAAASSPVLVFADARQTWAPEAIDRLVANLDDLEVGAVSGGLVVESAPGVMAGVGLYWRFEKWLRRAESRYHSMVSVTGCISAVRRELYRPIPEGTLLDDVYWPLTIAMTGARVVHEERAIAYDRLPERTRDEFRRKVRTLAGNFQLMCLLPSALLPWRNRAWWQFVSHRVMRLVVPWALLVTLITSAILGGAHYGSLFLAQVALIMVALLGLSPSMAGRSRVVSGAASFLVLNAAAWVGFWVWASGRSARAWSKVAYREATDGRTV